MMPITQDEDPGSTESDVTANSSETGAETGAVTGSEGGSTAEILRDGGWSMS
jgi:hypothetical protein